MIVAGCDSKYSVRLVERRKDNKNEVPTLQRHDS
jgi:hypothetical protein